jgi:parallel beta-helix repeat protein
MLLAAPLTRLKKRKKPMSTCKVCLQKWFTARLTLTFWIVLTVSGTGQPLMPPTAPIQIAGKVYTVAPTGNDSNPGTPSQPWKTIQKAANTMAAGDSTTVLAGNYSERVQVTRSGEPGASISFRAEGLVTMKGFTVNADYITISGFDISDTANDWDDGIGIVVQGSYCNIENNYVHFATRGGISLWGIPGSESQSSHCTVKNNRLYRNSQVGIEVSGRNHLVEGNEIWDTIQYHPRWANPPNWVDADGIRFFGTGHVIRKNYIHDIKYGIPENVNPHIDCFQTWSSPDYEAAQNIIFEQNICKNSQVQSANEKGQGFMIEGASNLIIRNNLIQAFTGVNAIGSAGLTIVNNTFASQLSFPPSFGPFGVGLTQSSNPVVQNNLFYDFPARSVMVDGSVSPQGSDIGYNLIYHSDGRTPSGFPYPHDLWQVNPLLVDPSGGDFHLQPNSPAIDAGQSLASVSDDFDSNSRPQGARYDIGAYETPALHMSALPAAAHMNENITFAIAVVGNGSPMTVTDSLPPQLVYLTSTSTCPGLVNYDPVAQQVKYIGTPAAGSACIIQVLTRVNTDQTIAVTNSATLDNGQLPPRSMSTPVILNGPLVYLPIIFKSG